MTCILCGNIQTDLLEIKGHVRDDVVEIFGARTEHCISEEEKICSPCLEMFEKLAILKRRFRYLILRPSEIRKPVDLEHIRTIISSLNLDDNEEERRCIPTPAPSSLYTVSHCTNYSSSTKRPRSRKKRGHGWTKKRRSSSRLSEWSHSSIWSRSNVATPYSSLSDFFSEDISRASTPHSDISAFSSISQMPTLNHPIEDSENKSQSDGILFHCPHCTVYLGNLNKLNYHIRQHHRSRQLFVCTECDDTFSTKDHLRHHSKTHDFSPFFCLICGERQENRIQLQDHLDLHQIYAVPCNYCDKSFLSKDILKVHYKTEHSRKKKEAIVIRKNLILFKKVYKKAPRNPVDPPSPIVEKSSMPSANQDQSTLIHPRLKKYLEKSFSICISPQNPAGLEVTMENLSLENVMIYTGEGYAELDDESDREQDNAEPDNLSTSSCENDYLQSITAEDMHATNSNRPPETQDSSRSAEDTSANDSQQFNGLYDFDDIEMSGVTNNDESPKVQENVLTE